MEKQSSFYRAFYAAAQEENFENDHATNETYERRRSAVAVALGDEDSFRKISEDAARADDDYEAAYNRKIAAMSNGNKIYNSNDNDSSPNSEVVQNRRGSMGNKNNRRASMNSHRRGSISQNFNDEEVLEQYRMVAQHEAHQRVREQILECEKRQKVKEKQIEYDTLQSKRRIQTFLLPSATPPETRFQKDDAYDETTSTISNASMNKAVSTLLPPLKWNKNILDEIRVRNPELVAGVVMDEIEEQNMMGENIDRQYIIVKCLGCYVRLKVRNTATLVGCPKCNTVCPAIPCGPP